ncbi:hypothetical protein C463_16631 [Halorubrum californiense DSM 19288]|uniref:Uncharacterized protein n=1 Tax=Halorubrum californiense DSM 19288 TaxID=1227465 RepID=M0DYC8_9EURY|nr:MULTISPECIES: hypothetical protein [Halorubrum]ELZ39727.1 hypothetical protein C463_16631 [Halorubrum californiense DSM 19288]TKX65057.1 hypothetical protein EXE40_17235 [Halorubrum sp. GN11GM_10-3_MGM]
MLPEFETEHLDREFTLPDDVEELTLPDVYVGLEIPLLAPGDGIVTDRHHASADRYEADDPQNQIGGMVSPFPLSGWLRHGCERVVQDMGATACHPGTADTEYMLEDVYERDLDAGYHEKGSCVDDDTGCVLYDLFGGFNDRAGRLVRRPIGFSPIRRQVDVLQGEAEAHYRQLNTQVRSRNAEDDGQPLRMASRDVVGNLVGTWKLSLRELKPEYVGLLVEAVEYLDAHSDEFELQLGGARNFGAGIVDARVVNPLYTDAEVKRVFNRAQDATSAMAWKDDVWGGSVRKTFVAALQERVARRCGDGSVSGGGSA